MLVKISKFRLTIPQGMREKVGLSKDGYIDINYDETTNSIIIRNPDNVKEVVNTKPEKKEKKVRKAKSTQPHKPKKNIIEANFMDADKLYKAYYSECGLVVRTKTKYVNSFCEKCQGQLAKEWEDRADVKCRFNEIKIDNIAEELQEPVVEVAKTTLEPAQEVVNNTMIDVAEIKKKRKEEIKHISESIKEATKVIDTEIETLKQKPKRGRPKKTKFYSTGNTVLKAVNTGDEKFLNCSECGQFVGKGFYLDDIFLCKECAVQDFKEYLKRRGN